MIHIQNLNFSYKKSRPLFRNISLNLDAGHIYGLLGKNGSGKSTLLKNLAGLTFPNSGECLIKGINSARRSVEVLEQLYFVAEEIYVPSLTTAQFSKSTSGFYPAFSIKDFNSHLDILDVDPGMPMSNMSYGQQKKAIIAFGLATNTSILIMDEPTNGLDIPSKVQFRKLIASALDKDRCIIISTHQVRDLDSLIDYLLILDNSKIVLEKSIDDLTEQLEFGTFADTTGRPVLYEEKNIKGSHAILQNTGGRSGKLDLELLFNGVISKSQQLLDFLKSNDHE